MKFRFLLHFMTCLVVGPASVHAEKIRVACMGDSITYGAGITSEGTSPATWEGDKYRYDGPTLLDQDSYPAVLQDLLGDQYDVRNFGASGRTVTGPAPGLAPYFGSVRNTGTPSGGYTAGTAFEPDVILLMLGTNDTKLDLWATSLPRFKADYKAMVQALQNLPCKPYVVICYPIPVEDSPKTNPASGITESNRVLLLPLINEVIAETGAGFINTNPGMPAFSGVLSDQVHPNHAGAAQLARIMDAGFPVVTEDPATQIKTVHGTRPRITISSPTDRSVLLSNGTLTVTANAFPETVTGTGIGTGAPSPTLLPITKVEFFQGTTKFGESTSEPYSAQLGGLAPGEYQILARATNSAGLTRDSEPITVFVSASTLPSGGIPFVDKYSQSFDALPREVKAATLPWSEGITLPGWYGATLSSGNWTASTAFQGDDGGSNVQVLKSLGKSWGRNRSLGTLSVNLTTWGLCLLNAGSTSISKVTISFTGEQWRVSSNPANNKDLFLQMSTTATGVGTSSGFTQIPELTFVPPTKTSATTTKLDGKLPANRVALQQTVPIPGGWQPGAPLWIRWTTGTGQSSIVAIEDLTIQAGGVSPASPELAIEPAGLRILWEGAAGNTYRLETSTDLSPGSWAPLDPPIQLVGNGALTGNFLYETNGETNQRRFFRVRLEP